MSLNQAAPDPADKVLNAVHAMRTLLVGSVTLHEAVQPAIASVADQDKLLAALQVAPLSEALKQEVAALVAAATGPLREQVGCPPQLLFCMCSSGCISQRHACLPESRLLCLLWQQLILLSLAWLAALPYRAALT